MNGLDSSITEPGDAPLEQAVTLLLTDIEGSTRLTDALGEMYPGVVARFRELLEEVIGRHGGRKVDAQGDELLASFQRGSDAVRAAVDVQHAFHAERWPSNASVRVRIGIHTGHPREVGQHYFGLDVHRTARIAAAAAGGQIVFSAATRAELGEDALPSEIWVRDLGSHRLKDLRYPETLFDVCIPGLPAPVGSLRSLDSQPNNLPIAPTTFVGRERQLKEVRTRLLAPSVRLLTLTGAGGTGKTRLAFEAAQSVLGEFAHGVFAVHLAAVSDPSLLASAIVQTLGLSEFASKTPLESLEHYLAQRKMLLLLDNFEQIVNAATDVVELLNHCRHLKILVTSREPLNVRLEHQYAVSPLQIPSENARPDLQSLAALESVRLLIDRVHAHDDGTFALTTANARALSSICIRLDGLPLALELAASWLQQYTPQALLDLLPNSIDMLTGGPRDLAAHQRTLKGTIAWSYDLLEAPERPLFRRLSVFSGGCTNDSAVALLSDFQQAPADIRAGLLSLVRKNLVTQTSVEGEKRLGMLETIRQFGQRQLEQTSECAEVHRRHAEHYLSLAERMAPGLTGRQQRQFVTPLLAEYDNLRAALTWAIQNDDAKITSRLLTALLWLWIPRGHFTEGRTWARRARNRFEPRGATREVGLILEAEAWLEALAGNYPDACPLFERASGILQTFGDVRDRVRVKAALGVTCVALGEERGAALSDEAVALSQTIDDRATKALALLSAGVKHEGLNAAAEAVLWYENALQAFDAADNVFFPGGVLQNVARLRLKEGDWERAAVLAAEALAIGRDYDYPMIRNISLAVMAGVALAKGTPTVAAQLFGAVSASLEDLGVTFEPPEQAAMDENIQSAKNLLGAAAFAAAFDEGRRWREADVAAAMASLAHVQPA